METGPIVLVALSIFVGVPSVIALAIATAYRVSSRRALRAERIEARETAVAEVLSERPAEAHDEALAKEPAREPVQVS